MKEHNFLSMAEQAQVSQYPIPLQKSPSSSALKPEGFIPISFLSVHPRETDSHAASSFPEHHVRASLLNSLTSYTESISVGHLWSLNNLASARGFPDRMPRVIFSTDNTKHFPLWTNRLRIGTIGRLFTAMMHL